MWRGDGARTQFFVYVMSNSSMTLYTGVTNDLGARAWAHKNGRGSQFTGRYHFDRLVYYESFDLIVDAIDREKQIKGWSRKKKLMLIQGMNPKWMDLSPGL
jgi:putative endonuclease